jgi:hypothetical protein
MEYRQVFAKNRFLHEVVHALQIFISLAAGWQKGTDGYSQCLEWMGGRRRAEKSAAGNLSCRATY